MTRQRTGPVVRVVGLGPAGTELMSESTRSAIATADRVLLRTLRHPAASAIGEIASVEVEAFDHLYDSAESFLLLYQSIVEEVVEAARGGGSVVYAVPGSPLVAEHTVELLRSDSRIDVDIVPSMSFLDLVWARLGVDPLALGVRIVDATQFAARAAGDTGPLLVGQLHSRAVASQVKLSLDDPGHDLSGLGSSGPRVVLLHHLGLADETVTEIAWEDLDRSIEPDHLTSLWIPELRSPVAGELVQLDALTKILRERCPWDREQTHASLGRHMIEEAYEAVEAIDALSLEGDDPSSEVVGHLEEELGDVLWQVAFHATLASERGLFTLADVARAVREKLVFRHPHVFGDAVADTPQEVASRWEILKQAEKGREGIFDGIPGALPALSLAAKVQRKAGSAGLVGPQPDELRSEIERLVSLMAARSARGSEDSRGTEDSTIADELDHWVGEALFGLVALAGDVGTDPEDALRHKVARFRKEAQSRVPTIVAPEAPI